jgi:hypothetical protein
MGWDLHRGPEEELTFQDDRLDRPNRSTAIPLFSIEGLPAAERKKAHEELDCGGVVAGDLALAQDSFDENVKLFRKNVRIQKKQIVAANTDLTDERLSNSGRSMIGTLLNWRGSGTRSSRCTKSTLRITRP